MARECPNCAHDMRPELFDDVQVDVCLNCGGSWFDADELRELLKKPPEIQSRLLSETARHMEQLSQGSSHLLCPNDAVLMEVHHYMYDSPIILHTCSHCGGFYLAAGDLAGINAWREHAHDPLTERELAAIGVAEVAAESEREVLRAKNYREFFNVLRTRPGGWFGFIP